MRALHWNGKDLTYEDDHPLPQPRADDALIRIHRAGICSTDLQILKGYMSFAGVPGHEFVGEVADGPDSLAGRRV